MAIDVTRYVCEQHLADRNFEFYGLQAAEALNYGPGSIYPVLRRLVSAEWLLVRKEGADELRTKGRPQRTYYRINPDQLGAVRQRVAEIDVRERSSRRSPRSTSYPMPELNSGDEVGRVEG
ncbi:hypothetical protein [Streptomyces sp. NPDC090080]|uniref:hypothetical protein n=1 Tax=Streptomyces sp. NPDC090080 TaxID=3365939 RepID=UPI00380C96C5